MAIKGDFTNSTSSSALSFANAGHEALRIGVVSGADASRTLSRQNAHWLCILGRSYVVLPLNIFLHWPAFSTSAAQTLVHRPHRPLTSFAIGQMCIILRQPARDVGIVGDCFLSMGNVTAAGRQNKSSRQDSHKDSGAVAAECVEASAFLLQACRTKHAIS